MITTESLNLDGNLESKPETIWLFSGGTIAPLDPDPNDILITDIAHALANQCRFTGHTKTFYSIAEHSILCASVAPKDLRLTTLLHDASEAYLCDIARPVKHSSPFKEFYCEAERRLEQAIAQRYGLIWPWPEEVKVIDDAMLGKEIKMLMPIDLANRWPDPPAFIPAPRCLTPGTAEMLFIERFAEYGG